MIRQFKLLVTMRTVVLDNVLRRFVLSILLLNNDVSVTIRGSMVKLRTSCYDDHRKYKYLLLHFAV